MSSGEGPRVLSAETLSALSRCQAPALKRYLQAHPEVVSAQAVEELAEAVRRGVRVDVDEASRLADAAQSLAAELGDARSLGLADRAKANAKWFQGDLPSAVVLFDSAVAHFEQAGREDEVGRTLSSSLQPLSLLGEYDRALTAAERARHIFARLNEPLRLARLQINFANIYHRQDRFAEALEAYQEAYQQLLPYKDSEGIAVALHNIAVCLIALNDFDRAMDTYREVRATCERHGMPLLAAQADYNIAYLFFLRGEYDSALRGLRVTRGRCHENGDRYHAALCDLDQSEIYLELNFSAEAERMARAAEEQFTTLGTGFEAGRALVNQAIAVHQQNDPETALELFKKATNVFVREKNDGWLALTRLYRAVVLFHSEDYSSSLQLCHEALAFFESAGLVRRALLCELLSVRILLVTDNLADARRCCESVMSRLSATEAPLLVYQARLLLGHISRMSGDVETARHSYEQARLALENLRSSIQREELRISFMRNRLEVYENIVELCMSSRSGPAAEEAFLCMERAKSRTLVELVSRGSNLLRWPPVGGTDGSRIRKLRGELNWYYRRIELEQTRSEGVSPQQIRQLWVETRQREDELLRKIRELPVEEDSRPLGEPFTQGIQDIRNSLHPRAAILEYFQIAGRFVVALVSRDTTSVLELRGSVRDPSASIRMLEFQLSKFQIKGFDAEEFADQLLEATSHRLEELYDWLIAPISPALERFEHLIIVPHGVLHCVPFQALMHGGGHLIDRFTISYTPSATTYAVCERKPAATGERSLLLGIPGRAVPGVRQEIEAIAGIAPSPEVHLGRTATETTLKREAPASRLLHIATHGLFRRDNPMFSRIRLANSYLTLYDLYHLHLPVELLTLSGCGTGLNVVAAGDELLGLMRGLLRAGARSVVLSLWDIHDRTTADFMSCFYKALQTEPHKAAALRKAMLEIRSRHPHPYYWAPFFLAGSVF